MKLNKEELESLQKFNRERVQLKLEIGNAEIEKFRKMEELSRLEHSFGPTQDEIIEKYGADALINPQTGDIQKR